MAASPAHTFGQYLGNVLEALFLPELTAFCDGKGLYVDCHGERPGIRTGKKATWTDKYGNKHDLDFVIEKNASATDNPRPSPALSQSLSTWLSASPSSGVGSG